MFRKALLLSLLVVSLGCMGCVVGVKENNQLLFVSSVPIPESANGAPIIATNAEIPLAIIGQPDKIYKQKVTGYILIDPWTWDEIVKVYNAEGR